MRARRPRRRLCPTRSSSSTAAFVLPRCNTAPSPIGSLTLPPLAHPVCFRPPRRPRAPEGVAPLARCFLPPPRSVARSLRRANLPSIHKPNTSPDAYLAAPIPCPSRSPRPAPQRTPLPPSTVCPPFSAHPTPPPPPTPPASPPPPSPAHHAPTQHHRRHRRRHLCSARLSPPSLLHDSALWVNSAFPAPSALPPTPTRPCPYPVSIAAHRHGTRAQHPFSPTESCSRPPSPIHFDTSQALSCRGAIIRNVVVRSDRRAHNGDMETSTRTKRVYTTRKH